jgi:hypothetical protein
MALSSQAAGTMIYLVVGSICLAVSLIESFFSMFVSIGLAVGAFSLAVCPLALGLMGYRTASRIFPAFVLIGCLSPILYIVSIYLNDEIHGPISPTAFIHEPTGWWIIAINLFGIALATRRIAISMNRGFE